MPAKFKGTLLEFFMSKVSVQENGCWWFTGGLDRKGYGLFFLPRVKGEKKKAVRAHRISYELLVKPIPEGLELDHQCHDPKTCKGGDSCLHRRCVNPDHLEPATRQQNKRKDRSYTETAKLATIAAYAAFTHCCNGHEYTEENVRITKQGWRCCKECQRINNAVAYERYKAAKLPVP